MITGFSLNNTQVPHIQLPVQKMNQAAQRVQRLPVNGNKTSTIGELAARTIGCITLIGGLTAFMGSRLFPRQTTALFGKPFFELFHRVDSVYCNNLSQQFPDFGYEDQLFYIDVLKENCGEELSRDWRMVDNFKAHGLKNLDQALEMTKMYFPTTSISSRNQLMRAFVDHAIVIEDFKRAKTIIDELAIPEDLSGPFPVYNQLIYAIRKDAEKNRFQNIYLLGEIEKNANAEVKGEIRFVYDTFIIHAAVSQDFVYALNAIREIAKVNQDVLQKYTWQIQAIVKLAIENRNIPAALEITAFLAPTLTKLDCLQIIEVALSSDANANLDTVQQIKKEIEILTSTVEPQLKFEEVVRILSRREPNFFNRATAVASQIKDGFFKGDAYARIIEAYKSEFGGWWKYGAEIDELTQKLDDLDLHGILGDRLNHYQELLDQHASEREFLIDNLGPEKWSSIETILEQVRKISSNTEYDDLLTRLHEIEAQYRKLTKSGLSFEGNPFNFDFIFKFQESIKNRFHSNPDEYVPHTKVKSPTLEDYKLLDVKITATESEIKKAYHNLQLKHHSDKTNDPNSATLLVKVNLAYERIKNWQKR